MNEADIIIVLFFPRKSRLCLRTLCNRVILEDITRPQELARKMSPTWHSHFRMYMGYLFLFQFTSVHFSSLAQSCPTLCDPMNCSTPGLPVQHQLSEFTQTHVHRVSDAIQPSHPLLSLSSPAPQSFPASECFPMSQLFA